MKPTYHHYSALGIAFAVFVASVVGYAFIYYSVYNQASKTAIANSSVVTAQSSAAQEKLIANSLAQTADDRATLGNFLISTDATVPFIEHLEGIGTRAGSKVSIASISDDTGALNAHVSIIGTWKSVMEAMHLIENIPYSLSMDNVRINVSGSNEWTENFDITIPLSNP